MFGEIQLINITTNKNSFKSCQSSYYVANKFLHFCVSFLSSSALLLAIGVGNRFGYVGILRSVCDRYSIVSAAENIYRKPIGMG